ncbi:MAG: hypothetical protein V3R90_06340, partial [Limibaculum sp.]
RLWLTGPDEISDRLIDPDLGIPGALQFLDLELSEFVLGIGGALRGLALTLGVEPTGEGVLPD